MVIDDIKIENGLVAAVNAIGLSKPDIVYRNRTFVREGWRVSSGRFQEGARKALGVVL